MMPSIRPKTSYRVLVLLFLLFGLPPVAGWIYILNPHWLPDRHKNHGTLVSPPRPLQTLQLQDKNRRSFNWATLSGRWTLVSHNQGRCDTGCRNQLSAFQQIRRAVGAERIRVERLLIQEPSTNHIPHSELTDHARGAHILYLTADQQARFNTLFSVPGVEPAGATYLVDPHGLLMMGYAATRPAKDILKDLETLLKASRNWTTGVNHGNG